MTTVYLLLAFGFVLPTGSIARSFLRENAQDAAEQEVARLCAQLPPARSLNPDDWPKPVSPLDLPGIGATQMLAAIELSSRVFVPAPEPIVVGLAIGGGRHHVGIAPGTAAQRARWNSPTGQFLTLIEAGWSKAERQTLSREWWCESCVEDHRNCTGVCACPCTLVGEVAA